MSILWGDGAFPICTGTLIHPRIVLTASHCVANDLGPAIHAVGFGEETSAVESNPARVVAVESCIGHPDFLSGYDPDSEDDFLPPSDIAVCRLAEDVTDVPIVPVLSLCESSALTVDAHLWIAGFGANAAERTEDEGHNAWGNGRKRYVAQRLHSFDHTDYINLWGVEDGDSACFGDSGGPAYLQLEDGSMRVAGVASHLYDPEETIGPGDPMCNTGTRYTSVAHNLAWLESVAGVDLSPCWEAGLWSACTTPVPTQPERAFGTWAEGCAGGPTVVPSERACEVLPPWPTTIPPRGGSTGGSESEEGGSTTQGAGTGNGSSTGQPADEPLPSETSGEALPGTTDAPREGDGPPLAENPPKQDAGCSCESTRGPQHGWGFAVAMVMVLCGRPRRICVTHYVTLNTRKLR